MKTQAPTNPIGNSFATREPPMPPSRPSPIPGVFNGSSSTLPAPMMPQYVSSCLLVLFVRYLCSNIHCECMLMSHVFVFLFCFAIVRPKPPSNPSSSSASNNIFSELNQKLARQIAWVTARSLPMPRLFIWVLLAIATYCAFNPNLIILITFPLFFIDLMLFCYVLSFAVDERNHHRRRIHLRHQICFKD